MKSAPRIQSGHHLTLQEQVTAKDQFKTPQLLAPDHQRPVLRTVGVFVAYINENDFRRPARTVLNIDGRGRDISPYRSEERRVGKECVSTCRSRGSQYN